MLQIESPVELETVTAKELAALFQARKVRLLAKRCATATFTCTASTNAARTQVNLSHESLDGAELLELLVQRGKLTKRSAFQPPGSWCWPLP